MAKSRDEFRAENHRLPAGRWPKPAKEEGVCEDLFGCSEEDLIASDPELFGADDEEE